MNVIHKCIAVLKEYMIINMMTGVDNRQMCQLMVREVVEVISTVTIRNGGCIHAVCTGGPLPVVESQGVRVLCCGLGRHRSPRSGVSRG